jgi:hypothetical protein
VFLEISYLIQAKYRFSTSLGRDREGEQWHHVEGALVEDIAVASDLHHHQNSHVPNHSTAIYPLYIQTYENISGVYK